MVLEYNQRHFYKGLGILKKTKTVSKRRWIPKSFSIDKDDWPVIQSLGEEARSMKPPVTESKLLVQILKDRKFVKDAVTHSIDPPTLFLEHRKKSHGARH